MNREQLKQELETILQTMDLPEMRVTNLDLRWLSRNMFVRNELHPEFNRATKLIRLLSK